MATASISINGSTPGLAQTDLEIDEVVTLANEDDTGVVSWEWVIVSQPSGTQDDLVPPYLPNPIVSYDPAPTFTPTKEGSYLIRLTVNKGLADEAIDTTICAVRELQTGDRIPAPQETTEVSDEDGWATEAVTKILQRVTRLSDSGIFVAQSAAATSMTPGTVVHLNGMATLGTGSNERKIPTVDRALAISSATVDGPLGVMVGPISGAPAAVSPGQLGRVMVIGAISEYSGAGTGGAAGDPVYVSNAGSLALTAGTVVRQVGDIAKVISDGVYDIAISAAANSIPRGNAGRDLAGAYPDPTVAKINATIVGTAAGKAVGNVLRLTDVTPGSPEATWGAVDLANSDAVTGTLPVSKGGTGNSTALNSKGVVYADSTSAMASTSAGTAGQPLISNGAPGNPAFGALDLATLTNTTGTLPVSKGGTGSGSALSPGGMMYAVNTAMAQSTVAAAGTGYILCSNSSSVTGTPEWIQTLPVNRGGTGQATGLTTGGVIYAASSSAMASTAAGDHDRVLIGGLGDGPSWNYVPTGAFASASVPIYALQGAALIFIPGSATYTNTTTTFTTLVTGTGTLSAGMVTFHITAKDDGSDFYTQMTSATNNHNVRVLLKFLVTGPSGFSKTYQYSYYSPASTAAAQLVGSFSFPVIAFLAPTTGSYTFTVQAAVDTAGDSVQVGQYRFYAYQG